MCLTGTGDTGIEKLMEAVFAGWYTTSIVGVLVAYFTSHRSSVKATLVCPLLYHVMSTYVGLFHISSWGVCNIAVQPSAAVAVFHGAMTACFGYLYVKT